MVVRVVWNGVLDWWYGSVSWDGGMEWWYGMVIWDVEWWYGGPHSPYLTPPLQTVVINLHRFGQFSDLPPPLSSS